MVRSAWSSLEIARRGLQASQTAIDLTGRNVANASTKGYSRQTLAHTAMPPYNVPLGQATGQIGTGVTAFTAVRYREEFLDQQYRIRVAQGAAEETWVRVLEQVEQVWGEPGSAGLQTYLNRFWDALKGLAARPAEPDARVQVIETGRALVNTVQEMARTLSDLRKDLDTTLGVKAAEINNIAEAIAGLNQQIMVADTAGLQPNDLRDKRDLLLDQLARLAGATWVHQADGQTTVYINSQALVVGRNVSRIEVNRDSATGLADLMWEGLNMPVTFRSGELSALLRARDEAIPNQYMDYLETLMGNLTREFNAIHSAGYYPLEPAQAVGTNTGENFFTVTYLDPPANTRANLSSLAVAIASGRVSAAENPDASFLDGGNAVKLGDVLNSPIITHPLTGAQPVSIMDFHRAVVGQLGLEAQRHRTNQANLELQVQQADNMRQSISGVSLDEEMTRLVEFQHSFSAAARLASVADELLDVLINRVGVVGR